MVSEKTATRETEGSTPVAPSTHSAVDGGYAWVVVGACCVSLFASVGFSIGGIGVATVSFGRYFSNSTTEELGWIGGLRNFQFMASPLAVVLIKLVGCRWTSIGGSLLSAAAIAASAFSGELWHAYLLYSVAAGVGISLTYTSAFNILGQYFDRKRNLAFSIVALGNALGIVVFPYLLQFVVDRLGHVWGLYVTAALKVIEVVSGSLYAAPPQQRQAPPVELRGDGATEPASSPADSALAPQTGKDAGVKERDGRAVAATDAAAAVEKSSVVLGMLRLLRHWQTWALLSHAFGFGASLVAAEALMPLYVTRKGVDADDAALGITMIGVGFLAAAVVLLVVGARQFDRFAVYVVATSVIGVSTAALTGTALVAVYWSLCGLFGVGMGLALSLFMSVLVLLGGALGDVAHLFGLYTFAKGAGSICGPVLIGLIQTEVDDDVGWYVSAGVAFLAAVILVPLLVLRRRANGASRHNGDGGGAVGDKITLKAETRSEATAMVDMAEAAEGGGGNSAMVVRYDASKGEHKQ